MTAKFFVPSEIKCQDRKIKFSKILQQAVTVFMYKGVNFSQKINLGFSITFVHQQTTYSWLKGDIGHGWDTWMMPLKWDETVQNEILFFWDKMITTKSWLSPA